MGGECVSACDAFVQFVTIPSLNRPFQHEPQTTLRKDISFVRIYTKHFFILTCQAHAEPLVLQLSSYSFIFNFIFVQFLPTGPSNLETTVTSSCHTLHVTLMTRHTILCHSSPSVSCFW